MQLDLDSADKIFHLVIAVGAVGAAWVATLIRVQLGKIALTQADNKAELVAHQTEIKDELNQKHAENTQNIAVHTAEDNQRFDAISRTLQRIDGKLDQLSGLKRI
jgi:hypothetical protein